MWEILLGREDSGGARAGGEPPTQHSRLETWIGLGPAPRLARGRKDGRPQPPYPRPQ